MPETYTAVDLDRRVTIFADAPPEFNWPTDCLIPVLTVPAKVEALNGRDLVYASQSQSQATHKIVIRWLSGFLSQWQIEWEDRALAIEGLPLEIGRRQFLRLNCVMKEASRNEP